MGIFKKGKGSEKENVTNVPENARSTKLKILKKVRGMIDTLKNMGNVNRFITDLENNDGHVRRNAEKELIRDGSSAVSKLVDAALINDDQYFQNIAYVIGKMVKNNNEDGNILDKVIIRFEKTPLRKWDSVARKNTVEVFKVIAKLNHNDENILNRVKSELEKYENEKKV